MHPRTSNGILRKTLWSPLKQRGIELSVEERQEIRLELLSQLEDAKSPTGLLTYLAKKKRAFLIDERLTVKPPEPKKNALGEDKKPSTLADILGGIVEATTEESRKQNSRGTQQSLW